MEVQLDAYFDRINYAGPRNASSEVLKTLHYLHPLAIPFENISSFLGAPVSLQMDKLQEKLLIARRGGYCYEQNQLFKAVLTALGFKVTGLMGRVRWNIAADVSTPRSHMLLLVEAEGEKYICDVGFGGLTLTVPLKLKLNLVQQTWHESFRIVKQKEVLNLEVRIKSDWKPVYIFALDEQVEADYEVANWYVATHPESIFKKNLIITQPTADGRISLTNTELKERNKNGDIHKQTLKSFAELLVVIKNTFHIELPQDIDLESCVSFTK